MNLHEYQGKLLFAEYDLPVSKGEIIFNAEDAIDACNKIGGSKWVVKAFTTHFDPPILLQASIASSALKIISPFETGRSYSAKSNLP